MDRGCPDHRLRYDRGPHADRCEPFGPTGDAAAATAGAGPPAADLAWSAQHDWPGRWRALGDDISGRWGRGCEAPSLAGRRRLFRIAGIDGANGGDFCRGADLAVCHGYRRPAGTARDLGRRDPQGGHGPKSSPPSTRTPPLIHAWWPGGDRFSVARLFQQSAPAFMTKAGAQRRGG